MVNFKLIALVGLIIAAIANESLGEPNAGNFLLTKNFTNFSLFSPQSNLIIAFIKEKTKAFDKLSLIWFLLASYK